MTAETNISSLATLEYIPYLDSDGILTSNFPGKVGVYAIFDREKILQFIGYSRDISLSLKQHLVRQPDRCYWIKTQTIDLPSRTILEGIRNAWIAENGGTPPGNGPDEVKWNQPINAKALMTSEEQANYEKAAGDEFAQMKVVKKIARRVEEEVLAQLEARGVKEQIRFNPKLKETGLLDLK